MNHSYIENIKVFSNFIHIDEITNKIKLYLYFHCWKHKNFNLISCLPTFNGNRKE